MPNGSESGKSIVQIQSNASLMTFDAGLYCIFMSKPVEHFAAPGFPAVKVTQAPNIPQGLVTISGLDEEGIISDPGGAVLVRVNRGPAQVLVTTYSLPNDKTEIPDVQVARLSGPVIRPAEEGAASDIAGGGGAHPGAQNMPEISAHIRSQGDVTGTFGNWVGAPGSKQWIEGFGLSPKKDVAPEDIEYQAMLGKGWLSPWVEGGTFCGSRGMALPILGLRVRLKNAAAENFAVMVEAYFVDGSQVERTNADAVISAESHAALEAFKLDIVPLKAAGKGASPAAGRGRKKPA